MISPFRTSERLSVPGRPLELGVSDDGEGRDMENWWTAGKEVEEEDLDVDDARDDGQITWSENSCSSISG